MFSNFNKQPFGSPNSGNSLGFGASTSQSGFGQSQLFGKSNTTGFGQPASTCFGQPAPISLFPSTQNTSTPNQGTNSFSIANNSGFGSTGLSVSANSVFNSVGLARQPSTAFGQSSFPAKNNPLFAGLSNNQASFGTSVFGQQQSSNANNIFGSNSLNQQGKETSFNFTNQPQQSNIFAPQLKSPFQSTGSLASFGNTKPNEAPKFAPVTETDNVIKNGVTQTIVTKIHCITCMKEYDNKSFEELRWDDIQTNKKKIDQQNRFSATPFMKSSNPSSSFFEQMESKSFTKQPSSFGQIGTFGSNTSNFGLGSQQPNSTNVFGKSVFDDAPTTSASLGMFGSSMVTSTFGSNLSSNQLKPFGTSTTQSLSFPQSVTSNSNDFNMFRPNNPMTGGNSLELSAKNTAGSIFGKLTQQNLQPSVNTGITGLGFNQLTSPNKFSQSKIDPKNLGLQSSLFSTSPGQSSLFGQLPATSKPFSFALAGACTQPSIFSTSQQPIPSSLFKGFSNSVFPNTNNPTSNPFPSSNQPSIPSFPYGLPTSDNGTTSKDLSLTSSSQFGRSVHLTDLLPAGKTSPQPFAYATNPAEIKKYLLPEKTVSNYKVQLKLGPPKIMKNKLFQDVSDEVIDKYYSTCCKRLFISGKDRNSTKTKSIFDVDASSKSDFNYTFESNDNHRNNALERCDILIGEDKTDDINKEKTLFVGKDKYPSSEKDDDFNCLSQQVENHHISDQNLEKDDSIDHFCAEEIDDSTTPDMKNADNPCGIILSRSEYYTLPPLGDLSHYINEDGRCLVKGFTIGRKGYGNVYFPEELDVRDLNLDEIVHFRYKEINMYPDESKKPPINEGLNRKAQVTLDKVYPRMKETKEVITDVDQILKTKFPEQLINISAKHGFKFVDYRPETGSWVFLTEHF